MQFYKITERSNVTFTQFHSTKIQAYLRDNAGFVPDHNSKANIANSEPRNFFGFLVHIKFLFKIVY